MRSKACFLLLMVVSACSSAGEPISTTTSEVVTTTMATSTAATQATTTTATPVTTTTTMPALTGLTYTEIASELPFPTLLTFRPSDGQTFVITKNGQVWTRTDGQLVLFLDISDRVRNSGEQGLLGMTWHPTDPARLFLHYSDRNGATVVSEFIDGAERVVFTTPQPAANHNGGMIAFGSDGYLHIALGDGGGGGDTFGTGQPVDDLLAGILRIDVDSGEPYEIPPENPYADGSGAAEVWSSGLRNPWRFWFDKDLVYIADVGQSSYEEINVAPAGDPGLNYGWPITEGLHCFSPPRDCDVSGLTLPVLEVPHADVGTCSITGGVVYRGTAIPELDGHYFFSDYCGGYLRSFVYTGEPVTDIRDWTDQVGVPGSVVSFGVDASHEMYLLTTNAIYRVDPVR
ncbi:MAG: PQQ-dependent sugar dehydrogenase [Acidimicrobiia bacterium]